jgi:predicted transcriptional regulator
MKSVAKKPDGKPTSGNGRQVTKKAQLIKLLGRKSGADITSLSDKLGWQQHTTRAALSGLRKAGYEVTRAMPANGGRAKYRILVASAVADDAAADVAQNEA